LATWMNSSRNQQLTAHLGTGMSWSLTPKRKKYSWSLALSI
jgi:hypothetical protein